jgi:biotin transport system substrate-specific component
MTSLAPASRSLVLADRVFPRSVVTNILLVLAGTGLVVLCAQPFLTIPMLPVPITMQTFAVLLVGSALGPARGAVSLSLYLVLGVAGLPVFANNASGSLLDLPTGGYIIGFVAASIVVGWFANLAWDRRVLKTILSFSIGSLVIYAFGVPWLAASLDLDLGTALMVGLVPFLIGDALKALLAAGVLPGTWKLISLVEKKPKG